MKVYSKKKRACCNQQNIAIEFERNATNKNTTNDRARKKSQIKLKEKSTKLKVQRKARKVLEIMSQSLC
jgi:hypothetical protein